MAIRNLINYLFAMLGLFSAVAISVHGIGAVYIAVWLFFALLFFFTHKSLSGTFFTPLWLILPLFYIIHLVGMLYTQNIKSGWFDLEVKLTVFILPIIFYFQHKSLNRQNVKFFKWFYLFSVLGISLFLLTKAILAYKSGDIGKLYYNELSAPYHPSYLAMYVVMALLFLFDFMVNDKRKALIFMYFIGIIYFLCFIFLLSSKAGILSAPFVLTLAALHYIFRNRKLWVPLIVIALSFLFAYEGILGNGRFKAVAATVQTAETDSATTESNAARWLVWQAGLEIVKKNLIFGVGTGDIKDVLMDEYAKRKMTGAIEKKLNAHNQFLETTIGQGIIGLFLLLLIFFIPFIRAFKDNNIVWMLFLVLVGFNFLFESMLNTQLGVFFFAYFYSFFIFEYKLKKI
ncbi:MAG TPA: O-antigen ligase family protein [Bacteroidales bacterium]|nr:O-antigen ligase family protein [Bacteroidales bacterium]